MSLELYGHKFKEISINKDRHFCMSVYSHKFSQKLQKEQVICHAYFPQRLKIYDLEMMLNSQINESLEFLENNKEFNKEDTLFYLFIELGKGLSFSPDLRVLKLFTRHKFSTKNATGINQRQITGIFPQLLTKIMRTVSNNYFGFERGKNYEIVGNYKDALKAFEAYELNDELQDLPEFLEREIY